MLKNYKEIRKKVVSLVKTRINSADIEDVTQNVMIKIWKTDKYEEQGKRDGWITAVTMNTIKNHINKQKRQPNIKRFSEIEEKQDRLNGKDNEATFEIPDYMTPEKVLEIKEAKEQIIKLLEQLPKEQRKCLNLFYKEYNNSEIEAILNKSKHTVSILLRLARKKGKKFLNEEEKISKMFCNYFV